MQHSFFFQFVIFTIFLLPLKKNPLFLNLNSLHRFQHQLKGLSFFSGYIITVLNCEFVMSLDIGLAQKLGLDENSIDGKDGITEEMLCRKMNMTSSIEEENDEEDDEKIELGPQFTLKAQLEKDKDDESLRKWKEQLLGTVDIESIGETLDPEVKVLSFAIKSPGRADMILQIPTEGKPKGVWFSLKEGSRYSLKFTFEVRNNIVSGLMYSNTVWKTGMKVDNTKEMLGTFSPQVEPYTHEMGEEITPSGFFARGSYVARTKFVDDDGKCYLEINYGFDIRKDWQPI